MKMLNLSTLLHTNDESSSCLHKKLDLTEAQHAFIAEARTAVRACLRSGIPKIMRRKGYTEDVPDPRFFTQGSWSYKTLNSPAQHPQQADIDDGCYLPLSFLSQTERPSIAAEVFFAVAEEALSELMLERKWILIRDKCTCIRIVISNFAHIDVPLYAIPDHEFTQLAKASLDSYGYTNLAEAMIKAERDAWTELPLGAVLLAHREKGWMPSDPRPLKDWFIWEVQSKGEQLRRIVRYVKAFRDWKWPYGGPSSILLMACLTPIFEKRDRRDDIALLDVVSGIPDRLRNGVSHPIDETESLTDRLGVDGVNEAIIVFEELELLLRDALHSDDCNKACALMREAFGERFPNEPARITNVSVEETILAVPAAAGPSELVGRTKAG